MANQEIVHVWLDSRDIVRGAKSEARRVSEVERCSKAKIACSDKPLPVGTLYFDQAANRSVSSFEYTSFWLEHGTTLFLDPNLYPYSGRQYPPINQFLFGCFEDSSPDRWGRTLMQRYEAQQARREDPKPKALMPIDYLLKVCDEGRMGALRYSLGPHTPFLADESDQAIPPLKRLRELEYAARAIEADKSFGEALDAELDLLLCPGSSLGGARPKATVKDVEENLWIAKFPSQNDTIDSGLAELLIYQLAEECGLNTTSVRCEQYSDFGHTFLAKRFDRKEQNRIHFASAMTLLGKADGDDAATGTSYLDIAEFIREQGSFAQRDLLELFKRIIFSVAVSNTDDHLRNHGFLLDAQGWRLSPLFDVNANPSGRGLSLNISEYDNALSFDLVVEQAPYFGITQNEAKSVVAEVCEVVHAWEAKARRLGFSRQAIEYLRPSFRA